MKPTDLTRPDKLLLKGLKTLGDVGQKLYSSQKSEAKARGELAFIGEKKIEKVRNQIYGYDEKTFERKDDITDFRILVNSQYKCQWLNFHGIHEVGIIKSVGEAVDLDRLTTRQILDTTQRPKVEDYDHYLFFSVKSILKEDLGELEVEQLSFVLGTDYVISFQEEVGDHFEDIRKKIEEGMGFIRKRKSDYLLAQLLDAILDNYFETIEKMNMELSVVERSLQRNPDKNILISLERHKSTAQVIKKSLGPFKEALLNIMNGRSNLMHKSSLRNFKDLVNSTSAAVDEVESTMKTLEGLTNIYFASLSQKMNETMKVLTTVATIFIPLTFIAGIYGMNFENMPELKYEYGYFVTWGIMIFVAIVMLILFKIKKWL